MWVWLVSLLVHQVAFGQVFQGTGAVSWEVAGNWVGGVLPVGALAVVINTTAQVTFDSVLAILPSFTLGGSANTQIILLSHNLLVNAFTWTNGDIVLNGTGAFVLSGTADVSANGRSIRGGEFQLVTLGQVNLAAGTMLGCDGCKLNSNGHTWNLGAGSNLQFNGSSSASSSATFSGSGSITVSAGAALAVATAAVVTVNNGVNASVSGVLQTSGTGKVSVSGGGWVWLNGGANVSGSFDVDGNLAVSAGTTAVTVLSVTTVSGSGNVSVNGRLDINADFTVTEAADFWVKAGGDVRVAAGVAVTLKSTRFDANSDWHLNFPETTSTFAGVTVSGALQLGGRLHVRVPVKPLVRTVLVTATSISGSFSATADITVGAGAGRRLLGTGQIFVTNTTIEYDPEGDTTSAASPLYYLSGLAAATLVTMF